jgi:DNA polymerase-3 subunit delta
VKAAGRSDPSSAPAPAYLVRGDDPALVAQAARGLLEQLVGDRDPALVVEEHGGSAIEELDAGAVVDACTTPPFLVDRRVVVVREAGKLNAQGGARLAATLDDPQPSTVLVLVAGGGTVPAGLVKAVADKGQVVDAAVGKGRERGRWFGEQVRGGPVRLEPAALRLLEEHLGDDVGRLAGILQTLGVAYGAGATVDRAQLEPFLGEAGSVPPWDLTDAVDAGSTAQALEALHRLAGPGGRSAPEILGVLHRHFSSMLRLDGADVASGEAAAAVLGTRSAFVGKKAWSQARQLGSERIGQAIGLLAAADLDVKGQSALPPMTVLEILVARLSRLVRQRAPARR